MRNSRKVTPMYFCLPSDTIIFKMSVWKDVGSNGMGPVLSIISPGYFRRYKKKAGVKQGEFHDFRRTCLTNWLTNGLGEYDVMHLAGHADFQTTHRFYLAVREDLIDRTREITQANSVANLLQYPNKATESKVGGMTSP